jgi:hypothetical protein
MQPLAPASLSFATASRGGGLARVLPFYPLTWEKGPGAEG